MTPTGACVMIARPPSIGWSMSARASAALSAVQSQMAAQSCTSCEPWSRGLPISAVISSESSRSFLRSSSPIARIVSALSSSGTFRQEPNASCVASMICPTSSSVCSS